MALDALDENPVGFVADGLLHVDLDLGRVHLVIEHVLEHRVERVGPDTRVEDALELGRIRAWRDITEEICADDGAGVATGDLGLGFVVAQDFPLAVKLDGAESQIVNLFWRHLGELVVDVVLAEGNHVQGGRGHGVPFRISLQDWFVQDKKYFLLPDRNLTGEYAIFFWFAQDRMPALCSGPIAVVEVAAPQGCDGLFELRSELALQAAQFRLPPQGLQRGWHASAGRSPRVSAYVCSSSVSPVREGTGQYGLPFVRPRPQCRPPGSV
jgi:hypothetical protein